MKLYLVDTNQSLVDAWRQAFADFDVHVICGNLLDLAVGTVVSPANSSGYMDGGIDADYLCYFGDIIQDRVRMAIEARPERTLSVGASMVIDTGHPLIQSMIIAPSMVTPERVPKTNCYRAFRAALRVVNDPIVANTIYCPGIGTGVGCVDPVEAANEMAAAYRDWSAAST